MNDGPPPSALDDPPLSSSSASSTSDHDRPHADGPEDTPASQPHADSPEEALESRVARKHHAKLLDLLNTYDSLVYMELAAIYYLDTSTILVILRTLVHLTQISHARTLALARASSLNLKPPRTNIFLVISINLVALAVHAFMAPAEANELTRGYLHGHLIVDLIGQKAIGGWTGRAMLCLMDCLIALLQVIAVGVVGEVDRAEGTLEKAKHGSGSSPSVTVQANVPSASPETIRQASPTQSGFGVFGFRRGAQQASDRNLNADVELQDLGSSQTRPLLSQPDESAAVVEEVDTERRGSADVTDATARTMREIGHGERHSQTLESFASGQAILMHVHLPELIRVHFWEWRNRRLSGRV